MFSSNQAQWDAVVIGAGPAGAVAARLLAMRGVRVLLVDRKPLGRDKVCGCCWSAGGLNLLRTIGAHEPIASLGGTKPARFHLRLPSAEFAVSIPEGLALSRSKSDAALVQLAIQAGASFQPGVRAVVGLPIGDLRNVFLHSEGSRTSVPPVVGAKLVIAADGLGHPSLRRLRDFEQPPIPCSYIGAGCHIAEYPAVYAAGAVHMAVAKAGYVGLVVMEDGTLNIAAAIAPQLVRRVGSVASAAAHILQAAHGPAIDMLAHVAWRGTSQLTRPTTRLAATRIFVIGDAAGYAEPFTGEGMTWAVLAACAIQPLALEACEQWRSELAREWTDTYHRLIGRRQMICRAIAGLLRIPLAWRIAATAFKLAPALASPVARFVAATSAAGPLDQEVIS